MARREVNPNDSSIYMNIAKQTNMSSQKERLRSMDDKIFIGFLRDLISNTKLGGIVTVCYVTKR